MQKINSTAGEPCFVCGTQSGTTIPRRKHKICSPKCYQEMQKSVLAFGQRLEERQREEKDKHVHKKERSVVLLSGESSSP